MDINTTIEELQKQHFVEDMVDLILESTNHDLHSLRYLDLQSITDCLVTSKGE